MFGEKSGLRKGEPYNSLKVFCCKQKQGIGVISGGGCGIRRVVIQKFGGVVF